MQLSIPFMIDWHVDELQAACRAGSSVQDGSGSWRSSAGVLCDELNGHGNCSCEQKSPKMDTAHSRKASFILGQRKQEGSSAEAVVRSTQLKGSTDPTTLTWRSWLCFQNLCCSLLAIFFYFLIGRLYGKSFPVYNLKTVVLYVLVFSLYLPFTSVI